jgi:predicted nucleic acid-binding protein
MADLLFADTNLLVYSLDPADRTKRDRAVALIDRGMATGILITSPQCLNECYWVLASRRRLVSRAAARSFVTALLPTCRAPLDTETVMLAWEAENQTGYSWWDCLLLAAALRSGCSYFLSEDLQDGQMIDRLQIMNPFKRDPLVLLTSD